MVFYLTGSIAFLHQTLSTRNLEKIDLCRFLLNDISHVLHQPRNSKVNQQFFRGLKVTNEGLEKLTKHTGKLICPRGFFTCHKSRKVALDIARSPDYRPDLRPVLFKIYCPPTVPMGEIATIGLVAFDVYTAFRVKCVNRGPVSIVKLEPADEYGRRLAREYKTKYKTENVNKLLEQLSVLPKPPPSSLPLSPVEKLPTVEPKKVR